MFLDIGDHRRDPFICVFLRARINPRDRRAEIEQKTVTFSGKFKRIVLCMIGNTAVVYQADRPEMAFEDFRNRQMIDAGFVHLQCVKNFPAS